MKISIIAALGTTVFAMTPPSIAAAQDQYGYPRYGEHDRRHDRLDDRHEDNHEELNEVHHDAHDAGLTRRAHRELHGALQYAHEDTDDRLARQHQRQDRWAWQVRYQTRDDDHHDSD